MITRHAIQELQTLTNAGLQAPAISIPAAREAERLLTSITAVRPANDLEVPAVPKADIIDLGAHFEMELFK